MPSNERIPKYAWLPSMAVSACSRLSERFAHRLGERRQILADFALMLGMTVQSPKGMRRTDQDILDGLTLASEIKILTESSESALLKEARRRGISFQHIARAMGLASRQAAEQRYVRIVHGESEAENNRHVRRRNSRFGHSRDTRNEFENHNMNLFIAFRSKLLDDMYESFSVDHEATNSDSSPISTDSSTAGEEPEAQ